jgi:dihydrofolate reductase
MRAFLPAQGADSAALPMRGQPMHGRVPPFRPPVNRSPFRHVDFPDPRSSIYRQTHLSSQESSMRKLIVPAFVTIDGVIQSPGAPEEDVDGGFALGGWFWPYADEATDAMEDLFQRPFELLLGRRTYDNFAGFWPHVAKDSPLRATADLFNAAAKHVATHRTDALQWNRSRALGPDPVAAVRELKHSDGPDLLTQGSSGLVRQLLATDLVDELILVVVPILLGRGKRLFDEYAQPTAFQLVGSSTSTKGNVVIRYVRDGDVRTGSM